MINIIEENRAALERLCRQYHVSRLEIFGSATQSASFDDENSDFDFLVEFLPLEQGQYADTYFGLLFALQDMLHRHVDLVMTTAIKNPYFLEAVNKERELIYAA